MSELTNAMRRLECLVNVDSLTKLTNWRRCLEVAWREFARSKRYQRPICLLVLDIDHFKKVTDNYGHADADDVLNEVAKALKATAREQDVTARLAARNSPC